MSIIRCNVAMHNGHLSSARLGGEDREVDNASRPPASRAEVKTTSRRNPKLFQFSGGGWHLSSARLGGGDREVDDSAHPSGILWVSGF